MEFDKVLNERFSVREYKDIPVEEEKIQAVLESVRLAPTAKNSQPHKIFVAKTKEALEKMDLITTNRFGAPVAMLICGDSEKACILKSNGRNFMEVDASIVETYMMLKATDLGLSTCWIGRINNEKVYEVLNLPKNLVPLGILIMGYKSDSAVPSAMHTNRLEVEDFTVIL